MTGAAAPPPYDAASYVTVWTIDPAAGLLALLATGLYVAGVRRLRTRGRRWSVRRSIAFGSGVALGVYATCGAPGAYDTTVFSAHVMQHLLLGVAAPFLLALGAPISLAIRAADRPTQTALARTLQSRPARLLSNPVVAWALFALTMFALYLTPLYELSLTNHWVHLGVHVHFLLAGTLFFWVTIGLDPVGWRLPYGARLLMVLLTIPFHSFLALVLMTGGEPVAARHYETEARTATIAPADDQRVGAGLMWALGEVTGLAAAAVVGIQWMRAEERKAARLDRQLDRQLAADGHPCVQG